MNRKSIPIKQNRLNSKMKNKVFTPNSTVLTLEKLNWRKKMQKLRNW